MFCVLFCYISLEAISSEPPAIDDIVENDLFFEYILPLSNHHACLNLKLLQVQGKQYFFFNLSDEIIKECHI